MRVWVVIPSPSLFFRGFFLFQPFSCYTTTCMAVCGIINDDWTKLCEGWSLSKGISCLFFFVFLRRVRKWASDFFVFFFLSLSLLGSKVWATLDTFLPPYITTHIFLARFNHYLLLISKKKKKNLGNKWTMMRVSDTSVSSFLSSSSLLTRWYSSIFSIQKMRHHFPPPVVYYKCMTYTVCNSVMMPMIQLSNLPRKPGPHQDGWLPYSNLLLLPFRNIKMLIFAAAAVVLFFFFFYSWFSGCWFCFKFQKRQESLCVRVRSASFMSHHCLFDQCQAKVLTIFLSFASVFVVWCCDCFDFRLDYATARRRTSSGIHLSLFCCHPLKNDGESGSIRAKATLILKKIYENLTIDRLAKLTEVTTYQVVSSSMFFFFLNAQHLK